MKRQDTEGRTTPKKKKKKKENDPKVYYHKDNEEYEADDIELHTEGPEMVKSEAGILVGSEQENLEDS